MNSATALVQRGGRLAEIEEVPLPRLVPGSALVRVEANGLCASDIEAFRGTDLAAARRLGDRRFPRIPGHEIVGVVEEMGAPTSTRARLRAGDRVAVDPFLPCGRCEHCLRGQGPLCRGWEFLPCYGYIPLWHEPGLWGGFSTHVYVHPNATLHTFGPGTSALDATQWNPLAAGVQWAVLTGGATIGSSVAVLGCGQRGLACIVAAKHAGAAFVATTGLASDADKLALAVEFGADVAIDVDADDTVGRLSDATGGRGVDVVIDTTPHATQPVADAVRMLRPGGTLVLAGLKGRSMSDFPIDDLVLKSIRVVGAAGMSPDAYAIAAAMISAGELPLPRMRTHVFGVADLERAIEVLEGRGPERGINVVITPPRPRSDG